VHGWVGRFDNGKLTEEFVISVKGFDSAYYYARADVEKSEPLVKIWLEENADELSKAAGSLLLGKKKGVTSVPADLDTKKLVTV